MGEVGRRSFTKMDVHLDLCIHPTTATPLQFNEKSYDDTRLATLRRQLRDGQYVFDPTNQLWYALFKHELFEEGTLCVPPAAEDRLLQDLHSQHGHPGEQGLSWLANRLVWHSTPPELQQKLQNVIKKCQACFVTKPLQACALLGSGAFPVPSTTINMVYLDFIEMPQYNNKNFLLVAVCGLSLFLQAYVCDKRC